MQAYSFHAVIRNYAFFSHNYYSLCFKFVLGAAGPAYITPQGDVVAEFSIQNVRYGVFVQCVKYSIKYVV